MAVRRVARLLMLAVGAAVAAARSTPAFAQDASWPQAVDRLAQEKVLAERCASILKTFGDDAPMARVQGQRLYARARADMDGLVVLLVRDLAGERSPAEIPELRHRLETVPKQRQALCRHVDAAVGTTVRERSGRTGAVDPLAEGSGDAASSMIDAATEIWQAYRHSGQAGRETITFALEGTRWRDYAEVPQA
jgi:hypothetical protein